MQVRAGGVGAAAADGCGALSLEAVRAGLLARDAVCIVLLYQGCGVYYCILCELK